MGQVAVEALVHWFRQLQAVTFDVRPNYQAMADGIESARQTAAAYNNNNNSNNNNNRGNHFDWEHDAIEEKKQRRIQTANNLKTTTKG